ncbi:MAG: ammonium transporter [Desulfovibrio sp.]|nr:MAG: ammonium transporter [Desulfovibrio sp.]
MDTGNTAFVLICAALVMFMTPGLALFYGGLTRNKNVLGTIMHSFVMLGLATLVWVTVGYTLSFGTDVGGLGIIGGFDYLFLQNVGTEDWGDGVPHLAFMIFQCMFAVITPALISGAFAERIKFGSFLVFSTLWIIFVYAPMCHWVWGPGGWMGEMGALDFAGGAVVHMSSGAAALAAALMLGKRKGYGTEAFIPHNLPMTVLGAGILWFGWFGFNAGSALTAGGGAANAFVTTHVATAAATLAWLLMEKLHSGKGTTLGAASGAVAGLVAITPAAGFVDPMSAIAVGAGGGILCYGGVLLKGKLKYDDALDVVGIHGIGGTWGALATGIFCTAGIGGVDGLIAGNPGQVVTQGISILATWAFCFVMSIVLFKVVDVVMGLRVSEEDEIRGLDHSQHNETGYQF